jgi:2'-5' RNA ligase
MRLFAAIDPPEAAVADLGQAVRRKGANLRWVPPEQWHVTLAFYGEVSEAAAEDLQVRLERAASRTPQFTLQIKGAGCFPRRPDAAKVLWAAVDGDLAPLAQLADRCTAAGRRIGLAMEKRKFTPHLTLARARQAADVSGRLAELWAYEGPTWQATTLRLVRSTLGAEVRHETLAEFPLGPS